MKIFLNLIVSALIMVSFGSCHKENDRSQSSDGREITLGKNTGGININILLDLSNRISLDLNPNQIIRDKEDIKCILNEFSRRIEFKKSDIRKINDRLILFFNPEPTNKEIAHLSEKLCVDFSRLNNLSLEQSIKEKRSLISKFNNEFVEGLDSLYNYASKDNKYFGSDIYDFFKDEVNSKCIKAGYTNILVILTDGYLYWKNAEQKIGNRYNYIERNEEHLKIFRNNPKWEKEFEEKDYGFICKNQNLEGLQILVLEIDPYKEDDFQILRKYWTKWFDEMKVTKYEFYKTGQPTYTRDLILKFFENL